jgi:hypothetical protein
MMFFIPDWASLLPIFTAADNANHRENEKGPGPAPHHKPYAIFLQQARRISIMVGFNQHDWWM